MNDTPSKSCEEAEQFTDVVASEFSFLSNRGYRSSIESVDSLLYESPSGVFVRVFRDPRDRYVGFRAGFVARPRDALTVPELARITGATIAAGYPESGSELRETIARLAALLRDYGERILSGDESILDEAMVLRSDYTRPFTRTRLPNDESNNDDT